MEKRKPSMFKIGDVFQVEKRDFGVVRGLIVGIDATVTETPDWKYTYLADVSVDEPCYDIYIRSEEILESKLANIGAKLFAHMDISKVLRGYRDHAIWLMSDFERDESDEEEEDIDAQYDIYKLNDDLYIANLKIEVLKSEEKKLFDKINALKEENKDLRKDNRELEVYHNSWKRGWIEAFEAMGWCGSCDCNHDYDICPEGDDRK